MRSKLNGKASIAFVTCDSQQVCGSRHAAINSALQGLQTQVVADQVALTADQVKSTCEGILTAHPDLDMFINDGLSMTVGCTAAVANLKRKTVVFGMDITTAIAQDVLAPDNILQATVGQDGLKMGSISMQMAVDSLHSKPVDPANVLIPGKLYSRDNPQEAQAYVNAHPSG
jgi:simple sugar transport system substrate-binding protein